MEYFTWVFGNIYAYVDIEMKSGEKKINWRARDKVLFLISFYANCKIKLQYTLANVKLEFINRNQIALKITIVPRIRLDVPQWAANLQLAHSM